MNRILNVFVTVAFAAAFVCDGALGSEAIDQNEEQPKQPVVGIENLLAVGMEGVGALGVGAAVGYGTFLGTSIVAWALMGGSLDEDDLGPMLLAGLAAGYTLGLPLGSAVGASSVGWLANQGGSFWWSWAGAELGAVFAAAIAWGCRDVVDGSLVTPILEAGPAAGAVVGYNLSRWIEGSPSTASLDESLGSSGPQVSLLVPEVELRRDRISKTVEPTYKLTLAKFNF